MKQRYVYTECKYVCHLITHLNVKITIIITYTQVHYHLSLNYTSPFHFPCFTHYTINYVEVGLHLYTYISE